MYIILRLICKILSWIAVKISFLWGHKHGVYAVVSFPTSVISWYLHKDMQKFYFCYFVYGYISLSDYLLLILKFYKVQVWLDDVKNF